MSYRLYSNRKLEEHIFYEEMFKVQLYNTRI